MTKLTGETESYWTPNRRELLGWFTRNAPSLADAYKASLHLLHTPDFPARVHLITHILRDMAGRLPDILEGTTSEKVEYENHLDNIVPLWDKHILPRIDGTAAPKAADSPTYELPAKLFNKVRTLVEEHKQKRLQPSPQKRFFLSGLDPQDNSPGILRPMVKQFQQLRRWFTEWAHLRLEFAKPPSEKELVQKFETFERIVLAVKGHFFTSISGLDELLQETNKSLEKPTKEQLSKAIAWLGSQQQYRYFFDELKNPKWIVPLRKQKFFDNVPPNERGNDNVIYPQWQASKYLARMAEHEPKLVAEIFSGLKTDNPNILVDMVTAAVQMPVNEAAVLCKRIGELIDEGIGSYLAHKQEEVIKLVKLLIDDTATKEIGFLLAHTYLFPKKRSEFRGQERDDFFFMKALESLISPLASHQPEKTLRSLCKRLIEALEADDDRISDPSNDYSYMWRPAIENHKENKLYNSKGKLVTPLRNVAEQIVRGGGLPLPKVLKIVRSYDYLIFLRLAMHLITEFAQSNSDLARQAMMEESYFDDHRFKHEYGILAGKCFGVLTGEEKETFLGWIDTGPDMEGYDDWFRSALEREPTEEDRKGRIKYWQYQKLWWIRDWLTGERQREFKKLLAKYGEPDMVYFNIRHSSSRDKDRPISESELEPLSFNEVIKKVIVWQPDNSQQIFMPAKRLQDSFKSYITQHIEECSAKAELLIGKPAMFVRPFIWTMSDAVNETKEIDYFSVFKLCQWVVRQDPNTNTLKFVPDREDRVDKNWHECHQAITHFIERCCKNKISFEYQESMWSILEPLTHDPDKDSMSEDNEDIRVVDFANRSWGNPRGQAIHAVFEYARWAANHIKQQGENGEIVPGGFTNEYLRKVKNCLETGLSTGEHDSFSVRAAYGMHTGLLYWIDKKWLKRHLDQIYNMRQIEVDPKKAFGWGAWNAFLLHVPTYTVLFELLKEQFGYAVEKYKNLPAKSSSPIAYFGQHLIVLYGWGFIDLNDHGDLIRTFLACSDQEIRSSAVSFVGEWLRGADDNDDEEALQEVVKRLMKLWEWYWPEVGSKDNHPSDNLFSSWYILKCFKDRKWTLKQLADYIQLVPVPRFYYDIPEQLAADAAIGPVQALNIMDVMVKAAEGSWQIGEWQDWAKVILGYALGADEATRDKAKELIDYLGRRGFLDLGELYRKNSDS